MQDYFLIHSRTRVSMIIFKLTVARGSPGLFSNWLSHEGVQEYFQIDCRTRGLGVWLTLLTLFTVDTVDPIDTVDTADTVDTIDTIEHYWTIMSTVDTIDTVDTIEH